MEVVKQSELRELGAEVPAGKVYIMNYIVKLGAIPQEGEYKINTPFGVGGQARNLDGKFSTDRERLEFALEPPKDSGLDKSQVRYNIQVQKENGQVIYELYGDVGLSEFDREFFK